MSYANFDVSDLPIVLVKFTGNKETDANFNDYLESLTALYTNKKDIALIFDATKAGFPNPKFQLKQASWMKENETVINQYCKGIAYVIQNAIVRKALQLILGVFNNKVPFKVFGNVVEAKVWVESKFHQ
jgi:hypothetical protein